MPLSYFLNGPITLLLVLVGSLLNACTIYVLSIYTISKSKQRKQYLSNIASILRINGSIQRHEPAREVEAKEEKEERGKRIKGFRVDHNHRAPQATTLPQMSPRPRIYTFMLWLSVSETALLISALLMYGIPTLTRGQLQSTYAQLTACFYLMSNTALTTSVWLMCALALDRYHTISQTFTRSSQSTAGIHKALLIVCLAAFAFSVPRFFEIAVEFDPESEEYYPMQTSLPRNRVYMVGYRIFGGLLFYSLLPYIILSFLSLKVGLSASSFLFSQLIWLVMRKAAAIRLTMSQGDAPSKRIAGRLQNSDSSEVILLCVTAKFLLSRLMPTVLDVVEHLMGSEEFTQSATLTVVVDASNLVVVLSSGANFFIFFALSHSFRVRSTECCCLRRRKLQRELAGSRRHLQQRWSHINGREKSSNTRATEDDMSDVLMKNSVISRPPPTLPISLLSPLNAIEVTQVGAGVGVDMESSLSDLAEI